MNSKQMMLQKFVNLKEFYSYIHPFIYNRFQKLSLVNIQMKEHFYGILKILQSNEIMKQQRKKFAIVYIRVFFFVLLMIKLNFRFNVEKKLESGGELTLTPSAIPKKAGNMIHCHSKDTRSSAIKSVLLRNTT